MSTRQIKIPAPFVLGAGPNTFTWSQFCAQFIFFDVRWMSEEWKPAFDRVRHLAKSVTHATVSVEFDDWTKLCESIRGNHERMHPDHRMDLLTMAQAVTCAAVKPEPQPTEASPEAS